MTEFVPKYRMLTAEQVSDWLGIPVGTLERYRSRPGRNPIPFVKVGKFVRYNERDIQKWIERNTYDRAEDAFKSVG